MAYVRCPSCERIGHVVTQRHGPDLCPRCGEPLPLRRTVIPISRYRQLAGDPAGDARCPAVALEPA